MAKYEKYTLPVGEKDKERLLALNTICNPQTLNFIKNAELDLKGRSIADVGCGIGILTAQWAELVGETGQVIAIDISEEQLAIARAYTDSKGLKNVRYICLNVHELASLGERVDLVYNRFLLEHLQDQMQVLENMVQLLNPGGYLFCENITSYEAMFCDPATHGYSKWHEAVLLQPKLYDTDFYIGKKLFSYYQKLGVKPIRCQMQQPIVQNQEKAAFFSAIQDQAFQESYVKKGFYSKEEIIAIADGVSDFISQDVLVTMPQYIQILGRKLR